MAERKFASESVTRGHPDVVCNKIANIVLDEAIRKSSKTGELPRIAMEVSAKGDMDESRGWLALFGEITLPDGVSLDYERIARDAVRNIGYDKPEYGFWHGMRDIQLRLTLQSRELRANADHELENTLSGNSPKKRTGAGDQGHMFGGAIEGEGPEFMPLPIMVAHALTNRLTEVYESRLLDYLKPDGKSQVVIGYKNGYENGYENWYPVSTEKITLAASHDPMVDLSQVRQDLFREVVAPVLDQFNLKLENPDLQYICNGKGPWTIFGPLADAGTTNRKIIVDSYGGYFPHGGGGFNGKDPTKVDVAGAVGARYIAKALVANNLARKVQIQVAYTIGQLNPDSVQIDTFGTEKVPRHIIEEKAKKALDLSVDGIIDGLNLWQPVYAKAAVGGWFGRREFPWEKIPSL